MANRLSEFLESLRTDEWFHVSSGDSPADAGNRGKTAGALKKSGWVRGLHFLKTKIWFFKLDSEVLTSIRLKDFRMKVLNQLQV